MNPTDAWINQVAYSHSDSKSTEYGYKKSLGEFCEYIHMTPEQILAEYETSDERKFKRKHTLLIKQFLTELYAKGMENTTIKTRIGAIRSFYNYNDLPLGKIPIPKERITYHNRDIEAKEIAKIMSLSQPREKAFYAVMAKSGLRPCVIQKLRLNMIENLNKEQKSYKIDVPEEIEKGKFGAHISFIDEEARKHLKTYLATRTDLKPDSLLFSVHGKPDTPINLKNLSRAFQTQAQRLRKHGELDYETKKKGKPSQLRLYTLRKFFKRKTKDPIGDEDTNWLMGHTIVGSNGNYAPKDPEYYRQRYQKALPFLTIDTPSLSDAGELMESLKEQHQKELEAHKTKEEELSARIERLENFMKSEAGKFIPQAATAYQDSIDRLEERNVKFATEFFGRKDLGTFVGNIVTIEQIKQRLEELGKIAKKAINEPLTKEEEEEIALEKQDKKKADYPGK